MRLTIQNCAEMAQQSYAIAKKIKGGEVPDAVKAHLDERGAQALMLAHGVLVIPGSNELSDWFRNFDVYHILEKVFNARGRAKSRTGAVFHEGFYNHARLIKGFARQHQAQFVIGHSLGAAAAQIIGAELGIPAVGFASPRVKLGRRKLKHEGLILNICRSDDLVTRVPPSETGFRRLGETYRMIPPENNKGMDHSMDHYIDALAFKAFEGNLPKTWGR